MSVDFSVLLDEATKARENDQIDRAVEIYTYLVENNVPEAFVQLGSIYRYCDGFENGKELSEIWYSKYVKILKEQSRCGNLQSIFDLGLLYQYGDLVEMNYKEAISLISLAAKSGFVEAQFHLSCLYRHGWADCEENYDLCRYWLEKAASEKHLEALYTLGLDCMKDERYKEYGVSLIEESAELGFWVAVEWMKNNNKIN